MPDTSLVNLGDFAKPVDTLIKKCAAFVSGALEPAQIRRIAEAKADAAKTLARADIEIDEVRRRAAYRWIEEETRHQINMESIIDKAKPLVHEDAKPAELEDDWLEVYFARCRRASSKQMQQMWAKVLAGEANAPGSFSKRAVNFLAEASQADLVLFEQLACFVWWIDNQPWPLTLNRSDPVYPSGVFTPSGLGHLVNIGLIVDEPTSAKYSDFHGHPGMIHRVSAQGRVQAKYFERTLELHVPEYFPGLNVGVVALTEVGKELLAICTPQEAPRFFDYVKEAWRDFLPPRP